MARTPRQPTTPAPDVPATLEANTVGSAVTKGRRTFLRRSGAWVGSGVALAALDLHAQDAARASSGTASPPAIPDSIEGARRAGRRQALRRAVEIRSGRHPQRPEEPGTVHLGGEPHAARGPGRHHHAERPVLRASSRRRARHRSAAAPADAAWAGEEPAAVHCRRVATPAVDLAYSLPRVLGQSGLHEAVRQDGVRSRRTRQLRRMDGRQPEAAARRSGPDARAPRG